MAGSQHVFVLGSARSGTSITYFALRKACGLQGRGESHVLPIYQRMLHQFHTYHTGFDQATGVLATRLDTRELREHLIPFIRAFYARNYPSDRWVDKTPGGEAVTGIPLIRAIFPDARIIILKRNGIEVVQSFRSKFQANIDSALKSWAHCMEIIARAAEAHADALLLDQFDIANTPQEAASAIATLLGEPDKAAAIAAHFAANEVDRHTSHSWSRRLTLADVDWSEAEKARYREVCGPMMQHFGYAM